MAASCRSPTPPQQLRVCPSLMLLPPSLQSSSQPMAERAPSRELSSFARQLTAATATGQRLQYLTTLSPTSTFTSIAALSGLEVQGRE